MEQLILTLILEATMALLLTVTIVYCVKLNRRIRVLQDSKSEFRRLIERFDATTQKAQESIAELQAVSQKVEEKLAGKLDKANFLADDLAFMIEKGNKVATRGMDNIAQSTKVQPKAPSPRANLGAKPSVNDIPARKAAAPSPQEDKQRRRASMESVLEKISATKKQPAAEKAAPAMKSRRTRTHARLRSRSEQELQDAMNSGG